MRRRSWFRTLTTLCLVSAGIALSSGADAAPALRKQVSQHGDFTLIGNTLGQECAPGTPAPVVGNIGACGNNVADSAPDIFWRADQPAAGQAFADVGITVAQARSTAVLAIPPGATITNAYLYWAAELPGPGADNQVTLDRVGGGAFMSTVTAIQSFQSANNTYQSVSDVTAIVQANGPGAYRVSGVNAAVFANQNDNNLFAGWWMVVFYQLAADPPRNLALFDGLDLVTNGNNQMASLSGFMVPNAGFDGKLGVVTFEGDNTINGDQLFFNGGAALTNAQNPQDNFFNGTRSLLGAPVSVVGDLPQLLGTPGSMSGIDLDVVDITAKLTAGQTMAPIQATSTGDTYYLAGFVTSISTFAPDFSTTGKTFVDVNGGALLPGDVIEYTIDATNTGNDAAVNTVLTDVIPAGVTYVPGSIKITVGANAGAKTDAVGDDQADFTAGTVTVRLGAGANAAMGGTMASGEATTVVFDVTVDANANGSVNNQATITAGGKLGAPPTPFPTDGNGGNPGAPPTTFFIDKCATNADCSAPTPLCDTGPDPNVCVACLTNADCSGATPTCDAVSNTCVPCVADGAPSCIDPAKPACQLAGPLAGECTECSATDATLCTGAKPVCVPALGTCGCSMDPDCGGPMSGIICTGVGGICAPGCSIAAGRNGCPANQVCSNQMGGVGQCTAPCTKDADCSVAPLLKCDLVDSPHLCVQCLANADCTSPLICDTAGAKTCVECTPADKTNCKETGSGSACLGDGTCGCQSDGDCGAADSGHVCDGTTNKCVDGCRGQGGNGCPSNEACSSMDMTIGQCSMSAASSSGADGNTSGTGGKTSGAGGNTNGAGGGSSASAQAAGVGGSGIKSTASGPAEDDHGVVALGSGCACSVPNSGDDRAPVELALGALGLAWALRKRKQRAA